MDKKLIPTKKTVVWGINKRKGDHEGLVLGERGFFKLDQVASMIWEKIDGNHTVEEIIKSISSNFPSVSPNIIENDIMELLNNLSKDGLISFEYKPLELLLHEKNRRVLSKGERDIDIFLCSVPSPYPREMVRLKLISFPPLGIGYIASFLEQYGFKVECANLSALDNEQIVEIIEKIIIEKSPKIIGFSVNTEQCNSAITLANFCKNLNPEIIVVVGGAHPTFKDLEMLKTSYVDVVVRNEGEITMLELAKFYLEGEGDLNQIKGISFKNKNGEIRRNPNRSFIENLDSLPFPKRDIYPFEKQYLNFRALPVSTSRGCPHNCVFCSAGSLSGGRYRMRSPKNVAEEIKSLKERGINIFHFVDDTVTAFPKRLMEICDALEPLDIEWSAESRVDVISRNKNLVKSMKKAGCVALQFGIESPYQSVLDSLNKKIKVHEIIKAIEFAREEDITVAGSMIIGLPNDTFEDVQKAIDFGIELERKFGVAIFFGILTPFPGTQLFESPEKFGIRIHSFNHDEYILANSVISTKYLSKNELTWLYIDGLRRALENMPKEWIKIQNKIGS